MGSSALICDGEAELIYDQQYSESEESDFLSYKVKTMRESFCLESDSYRLEGDSTALDDPQFAKNPFVRQENFGYPNSFRQTILQKLSPEPVD